MKEIFVVSGCRTAIGAFGGSLKDVSPAELGAVVVKGALERAGLGGEKVDELMFGCCLTAGKGQNVARQVGVAAALPFSIPAYSINMVCGSGLKAVIEAARAIAAEDADIVVCGGTESMSQAPYLMNDARWGARMFDKTMTDSMVCDGLWDAFNGYHMGTTAENICDVWGLTRAELDEFTLSSQQKWKAAHEAGKFAAEIVPVEVKKKKQIVNFDTDEFPKPETDMASLEKLRPVFPLSSDNAFEANGGTVVDCFGAKAAVKSEGERAARVTAGNASGINDGAAALVLASKEAVEKYNLKPIAKLVSWGQGGVDPKIMGTGPVPAVSEALKKAKLSMTDIDLVEANEAFAAQSIAVARELSFDMEKVNVNGGALAIGHPVGASGARIIVTLLHEMQRRDGAKRGLATLCIGGGMGVATIWEKV